MASIVERTIGGATDRRLALLREQCGRTISIGSSWNKIRLGIHLSIDTSAAITQMPSFVFGLCSGMTNMYTDETTDHFVGVKTPDSINTTNFANYIQGPGTQSVIKIGTTETNTTPASVTSYFAMGKSSASRSMFILEITKGSPNYIVRFRMSEYNENVTTAQFRAQMQAENVTFAHGWTANQNFAIDEATNGNLDTINIAWMSELNAIEISAVSYSRLA